MAKLTVYSKPNCPYCDAVKNFLTDRGAIFDEKDVTKDREAFHFVTAELGYSGVPVTVVEYENHLDRFGIVRDSVVGFNIEALNELLKNMALDD